MLLELLARLGGKIREVVESTFGVALPAVAFQYPPRADLGDLALTAPFDLAKSVRRKPRDVAEVLAPALAALPGVRKAEVAGGGYLNLFLERGAFARELCTSLSAPPTTPHRPGRVIVEHTSINPNKAAHIGHLRNAALGDTFVRILRNRGHEVGVQNYIDDTGVQVADVVVGFERIEGTNLADVEAIAGRFDYYCWDLYARVGDFYAADPGNRALQAETLHAIESGDNDTARLAAYVAARIVDCHLTTMERIGVRYDLLAHESDILRLHFWDRAFDLLKQAGAIRLEAEGKSAGCWVLSMGVEEAPARAASSPPGRDSLPHGRGDDEVPPEGRSPSATEGRGRAPERRVKAPARAASSPPGRDSLPHGRGDDEVPPEGRSPSATEGRRIDEDKIIVRSNGTVTYTGKDIAYQLWKLGLLDCDFRYRRHRTDPDGHVLWSSTSEAGERGAPAFGHAQTVYNVIDVGQSYPQRVVKAGVAALGHAEAAAGSHHLGYEKVVLSPATARTLGYAVSDDETAVKVSGRKGLGVKADDLLDALVAKARAEIETRDADRGAEARDRAAKAIATGALRYFLLKYSRAKIITFDMEEALAFVGETGPYIQNGIVRARNIFAKMEAEGHDVTALRERGQSLDLAALLSGEEGDEVWSLLMLLARSEEAAEQVVRAEEVALLAKHAFAVAQAFHSYYQKPQYSVLYAGSDDLRAFRTLVVDAFLRQAEALADLLGIPIPDRM